MAAAAKIDLYKLYKSDYVTPKSPVLMKPAAGKYLAITGEGAPGGEAFQTAIGALYAVAYTLKFASKSGGKDYGVAKVEGLWWGPEGQCFSSLEPDQWNWKLLIRLPAFIRSAEVQKAVSAVKAKGNSEAARVQLETIEEGPSVQMLHVGPYAGEPVTIAKMREFAEAQGKTFHGLHHEIYLSDPRRTAPEKLRTILRIPVC